MSSWRDEKNQKALLRLNRCLSDAFPKVVLDHAMRQPLIPPTQRLAVESYWRHRPLRAERLSRALAARSGTPAGWQWQLGSKKSSGLPMTFRTPPAPFRESAFARGPGYCCVCGQPVYKLGWHRDLWNEGKPNKNATWHTACVTAWKFWTAPSDYLKPLKVRQGRKCLVTGGRLFKTGEVDHRVPLYEVWGEHRARSWPELLAFWGAPNLQVINRVAHLEKCSREAGLRAEKRLLHTGEMAVE